MVQLNFAAMYRLILLLYYYNAGPAQHIYDNENVYHFIKTPFRLWRPARVFGAVNARESDTLQNKSITFKLSVVRLVDAAASSISCTVFMCLALRARDIT